MIRSLRRLGARFSLALERASVELVGINGRNLRVVYPHNARRHFPIADDKIVAKEWLSKAGVPVPDTLFVARSFVDLSGMERRLAELDEFVIKPANGSGGGGIVVVIGRDVEPGSGPRWVTAGGARLSPGDLRRHAAEILFGSFTLDSPDAVLVEDRLVPHPVLSRLFPDGLSDVRVLSLRGTPFAAMVRVPTVASGGRANLHQGAIGLAVDLGTGVTTRALLRGERLERHPDTRAPLVGVELPDWATILEIAVRSAAAVPLGYLGVDIGLDARRGPVVLEINKRPGLEIQNVLGRGLRGVIEEIAARPVGGAR